MNGAPRKPGLELLAIEKSAHFRHVRLAEVSDGDDRIVKATVNRFFIRFLAYFGSQRRSKWSSLVSGLDVAVRSTGMFFATAHVPLTAR